MKRLAAKRILKRTCECCNKTINKGEIYYKQRFIYDNDIIYAYNKYMCAKCYYKMNKHNNRYEKFKKECTHPNNFIKTKWHYIPGECIMEPNYNYCLLCKTIII